MKPLALILAALIFATPVWAQQHSHGTKGPNGGILADVAGVHVEFVPSGNALTFNVFSEDNKPVSTKGYSGSVLVVIGQDRETITLSASGENALKGEAKKPIAPGTAVTLMIRTDGGKTGQAKYKG
ncbi:MAG: hypothetical protein AB7I42_27795 [Bradyrhizobium sp.]|uniref:hypothetical protein n=1 Tax=Bradyrhizobium sp. TaxID=376 RepID=UPI003D11F861